MKFGRSSNHLGSFASDPSFGIAGNTYWNTASSALKIHNGTTWGLFSSGGGGDLELGETSTSAYRGDRGKTAYDHSQTTHDKTFVGLGNVDNTSDANKPVSTTQQTALDLKANLISPSFTGTPLAPTASVNTNTTQVATTAFVVAEVLARLASNDAMLYKGVIDCSTNPNYPASDAGHTYRVSVAGKIGGASGPNVEVGDRITCNSDGTSVGTHASVGSNWDIIQVNIDGAVTGQTSSVEDELALFSGSSGKVVKRASSSGIALLTSGVLSVLGSSGSGDVARVNSPTFVTPTLGVASATELSVGDDAYGAGWNGSTNVPTKNAVYDKIESMGGGGGSSYDESNPILDSSSNELLKFTKVTSAVNEITVSNNSTGNNPIISATGEDTDISIQLVPKGIGTVRVRSGTPNLSFYNTTGIFEVGTVTGSGIAVSAGVPGVLATAGQSFTYQDSYGAGKWIFASTVLGVQFNQPIIDVNNNELIKFTPVASAVNEVTISNNSTGNAPIISATGGDTNIDLRLSPKGTGVLIAEAENGLQYHRSGVLKGTISAGWGGLNITMGGTSVDPATISVGAGGSVRVTVAGDNCGWSFHSGLGIAFAPITQTQFTTNQDNLNLHNGVQRGGLHQRWSSDASRDVTGLVPQTTVDGGTTYTIWNVGSFNIVLKHDSASSTATNRILCSTGADLTLAPNGCALVMYDSVTTKWRATLLA